MSKRIIMYLMAIAVFVSIYYKEYKRNKAVETISVLQKVSARAIDGTDPIRLIDINSIEAISNIYEGLYTYHPFKRPFEIIPNLADGMPSISLDGLVYTLKIKRGVLFQDNACFPNGKGRELKAADFVFSLKRLVDPKNIIVPYIHFMNGTIQGLDAWKQPVVDYAQEVEGLKALDDYTLQVTLTAPWPGFLNFLTMPPTFVVAKEAVMHYGAAFLNHPVGTGPFILQGGFDPQAKKLEFVKNPTFREKLFPADVDPQYNHMLAYVGKKLPLLDKVVTHIITEEQPRWLKIQNADIDLDKVDDTAFVCTIVKDRALLPELIKKGLVLDQIPSANIELFAFNHSHELFRENLYLRQAMSMAFDREAYNQMFYHNTAEIAKSLVPPVLMNPTEVLVDPYAYNLERAKEYLTKAGYPGGKGLPVIMLDCRAETAYKNKSDFFAKCMEKVGIKVQVITNIWPELAKKVDKNATMMHAYNWLADEPDPAAFLQVLYSKRLCGLQYENAEFNTLFDKAVATANHEIRYQLAVELNKMAIEQVPMICAVHRPFQFLYYKWVKNFAYNEFDFSLDQYIAVDKAERARLATK